MIKLTVNNTEIEVEDGTSVMQAAASIGIQIPSMCYLKDHSCHPSCMVCLVKDQRTGNLFPSCAMPCGSGMQLITNSPDVLAARKEALELLLSDHVGDCEAPCRLSCPAFMNIPLMNRLIAVGNIQTALEVVLEEIALPLVMGYICAAPCEKACHRKSLDGAVSICLLKRFTAVGSNRSIPQLPLTEKSGKKVAVIGTGPAGLSAAFYLLKSGHTCILFDKNSQPGGTLRYEIPDEILPGTMLDADIDVIRRMGGQFIMNHSVTKENWNDFQENFDAVILAAGIKDEESKRVFGEVFPQNVFTCGSFIREQKMAIRSAAQGKSAAMKASSYLSGTSETHGIKFNSRINKITQSELLEYLKESTDDNRFEPEKGFLNGFNSKEAIQEAKRCLHCDCRKAGTCKLRNYSDEYKADRNHFAASERKLLTKSYQHDLVVYEPQKCIRCGLCVEIAGEDRESAGLTYIGRGFDVEIGVPFNESIKKALTSKAEACVKACPTAALSFKIAFLIVFLFSIPLLAQQKASNCWPSFRGDNQLSGNTAAPVSPPFKLLWTFKTGDAIKSSAVIFNDIIYIGSNDGNLYALTTAGQLKWKYNTKTAIEAPPLILDNTVFIGSLGGILFAFDANSGKLKWKYKTDGQISGACNWTYGPDKIQKRILVGSYDFNLYCLDASSGKVIWKFATENFINGSPAISGRNAVFGGCDGMLRYVNTDTGKETGNNDIGTYIPASPTTTPAIKVARQTHKYTLSMGTPPQCAVEGAVSSLL